MDEGSFIDPGAGNFYIGLSYNPAIGKVRDFAIKESTGETKGVFPYKGSKKKVELKAINFDWESPDPRISFRDSKILAFDGSIGYGI
ncbi:P44/Msp2 family outer membrane protein, partial [Anaplasma bovis]|uniref:P44/Msp2 family outer membrane protein n=1 Tax=Anaplasma bovis TaxID=186733 RepID=UPI002FF1316F